MKKDICQNNDTLVDAYYDGQMGPEEARKYEVHLARSSRALDDYASISKALKELARQELGQGEGVSFWPEIRSRLVDESPAGGRYFGRPKIWFWPRPAWIGLTLSAAAALIIFFSGILRSERRPINYCRIEAISAPEHNLMIHRNASDGFTIIWLME